MTTKRRAFIRGLWGDSTTGRREKVLAEMEGLLAEPFQPAPVANYAFGPENARVFEELGQPVELVDSRPVIDWREDGAPDVSGNGSMPFGTSMWRLKLKILLRALQEFEEVVWLDLDAHLVKPVPDDFWDRLGTGAAIQMPLVSYKARWNYWRGRCDTRSISEGAFIYCRDRSIIEQADSLYDELKWMPHTDQTLLAYTMDQLAGKGEPGQFTVEGYRQDGYEPYCVDIYNQFFPAEERVFLVTRGPSHARWLGRKLRREAAGG